MADEMLNNEEKFRSKKVLLTKWLIELGLYDEFLDEFGSEIFDVILYGKNHKSQEFLEDFGIYEEVRKASAIRVKLSFYATIVSAAFGFILFAAGIFFYLYYNHLSVSIISMIGSAISTFIARNFEKMHLISLAQQKHFCKSTPQEILKMIYSIIELLPDIKSKKLAYKSIIKVLLSKMNNNLEIIN